MVKFEEADIFTAQQLLGNLTVTGPEQAKMMVMLDNILKKGVVVNVEGKEKEGNADGSSKK